MSPEVPSATTLRLLAAYLGIDVPDEDLEAAAAAIARLHPAIQRLREVRLDFVDFTEPGHAGRWIENGGRRDVRDEGAR